MRKFIQFQLWTPCKNNCEFCYLKFIRGNNIGLQRIESLKNSIKILNSDYMDEFSEVGIIGGEFFNGELTESIKPLFYEFCDLIVDRLKSKKVNRFLIMTSLIYDINIDLIEFLSYLKSNEVIDKCIICTSFDTLGRFKSYSDYELWESNMRSLAEFPIRTHTEIMITQAFLDTFLTGEFNIDYFESNWNTVIDFIELQKWVNRPTEWYRENFEKYLPRRSYFLKFLSRLDKHRLLRLFDTNLHSDHIVYNYENNSGISERGSMVSSVTFNGRSLELIGYFDSDIKLVDDINRIRELVQ